MNLTTGNLPLMKENCVIENSKIITWECKCNRDLSETYSKIMSNIEHIFRFTIFILNSFIAIRNSQPLFLKSESNENSFMNQESGQYHKHVFNINMQYA